MNHSRNKAVITPSAALESLPRIAFDPEKSAESNEFGQAELLQSVLLITQLDHIAESQIVRDAVKNALGKVPEIEA